jgi:hypothetical protein
MGRECGLQEGKEKSIEGFGGIARTKETTRKT